MSRVLVVGPGALGVSTAVRLHQAGHDVCVAVRSKQRAEELRATGLRVTDGKEEVHAALPLLHAPKGHEASFDFLIHTPKAAAATKALKTWLPTLKPDGVVIPYQNGLLGDELAKTVAGHRFVECAVYYAAHQAGPGHSRITGPGELHVGRWPSGKVNEDVVRAVQLLFPVFPTTAHEDMHSVKWNKLVTNSAMTSIGVVSGKHMADMMKSRDTRRVFLELIAEGVQVLQAAGATPMRLSGFNPAIVARLPRGVAHAALRLIASKYADYRSSSGQSLDRGEPTEVDILNGRIVQEADRFGVPAPWNRAMVDAVHRVEADPSARGDAAIQHLIATASH